MNMTSAIRTSISLLPIVALLAASCVETGDGEFVEESASAVSRGEGEGRFSRAHLMPMPGQRPFVRAAASAKTAYNFTYHGGPVISRVKVFTIFWGTNIPNRAHINAFYQGVTNSAHMDWLAEYNTPTQTIGRGTLLGSHVDSDPPADEDLADKQIQKEITRLIQAERVPAPDADTLYMLHFPKSVSITIDGARSCQQFCAYHGSYQWKGQNVYYGVMPEVAGGCGACGGTSDKFQNTTIIASHELIEAITDPGVGLANERNDISFLAWYDDQHGEVGDVCEVASGVVDGWAVQAEYSMVAGRCIISRADGGGTPEAACNHGVCRVGGPLRANCGPCTEKVCEAAPACCQSGWDASCIQRAEDLCGKTCQ